MSIKTVYTDRIIYHSSEKEEEHPDKITLTGCKLEQTSYGSIIVIRLQHKVELYPQIISHVIHNI